jgi:hypothetical protein
VYLNFNSIGTLSTSIDSKISENRNELESVPSRGTQSAPQSEQLSLLGARSLGDYVGVASPPEISPGSHRLLEGGDAS